MGKAAWCATIVLVLFWSTSVALAEEFFTAQRKPLFGDATSREPLLVATMQGAEETASTGSLFAGTAVGSLFEPIIRKAMLAPNVGVKGLKNLIATAEAGAAQYDAVVFSAPIKPSKNPTDMTVAEIYRWIDETPGQNHAIGRYQFIPKTLRMLMKRGGFSSKERFSPSFQDQLAMMLLEDAGLSAFLAGELPQKAFMNNLAKIWAGLPNSSGKSHYHGYSGNKNTITWERFEAAMKHYFPQG